MATPIYMKRSPIPLLFALGLLIFSIPLNIHPSFAVDCSNVPGMFGTMGMLFEVTGEFPYQTLLPLSIHMIISAKAQVTARTYQRGNLSFFTPGDRLFSQLCYANSYVRTFDTAPNYRYGRRPALGLYFLTLNPEDCPYLYSRDTL